MPLVMGSPWQGGYFGSLNFGFGHNARLLDGPPPDALSGILLDWNNQQESLTESPLLEITNTMRTHIQATSGFASVTAETSSPLITGGGPYLHTKLTNNNPSNTRRCERHPIGQYISDVTMDVVGTSQYGNEYASPNPWWYAFRMRIDACPDTINGIYAQWHDQAAGSNPSGLLVPVWLNADSEHIWLRMADNIDQGTFNNFNFPDLYPNAQIGIPHKYIFEILWDTRSKNAGGGGYLNLYIDDETTPRNAWVGQTCHSQGGYTSGRAPNFKYGLYKAPWTTQGTPGAVCEQSYDDLIIVEDTGQVADMRASIVARMDNTSRTGIPNI